MNSPAKPPRVFVPMVPARFDHTLREWLPSIDITPAKKFGDLIIMLPPDAAKIGPAPSIAAMKEAMKGYTERDFILPIGDPALSPILGVLAWKATGGAVRVLKWDRQLRDYVAVELRV